MTSKKSFPEPIPNTEFSFSFLFKDCRTLFSDFVKYVYLTDPVLKNHKNSADFSILGEQLFLGKEDGGRYVSEHLFEQYLIQKYRIFVSINVCGKAGDAEEEYPSSISTYLWYNEARIDKYYNEIANKIEEINSSQMFDCERVMFSDSKRLALGYASRIANLMCSYDKKKEAEKKKKEEEIKSAAPKRMMAPIAEIVKSLPEAIKVDGENIDVRTQDYWEKVGKKAEDSYNDYQLNDNILAMNAAMTSEEWEDFIGASPF